MSAAKRVGRFIETCDTFGVEDHVVKFSGDEDTWLTVKDLRTLVRKAEAGNKLALSVSKFGKLSIPISFPSEELRDVLRGMGDSLKAYKSVR